MKLVPAEIQQRITALASVADAQRGVIQDAIYDLNDTLALKLGTVEDARRVYNTAIRDLHEVYQDLADRAQSYYDDRSDRWRESDAGTDYEEWLSALAETAAALEDIPEFELEELSEPELFDGDSFDWPNPEPG
jgi:hypothetical protein